jgi:DnaJ-class molecular chaperone
MAKEQKIETCPKCNGRGQIKIKDKARHMDIYEECPKCKGTGEVKIKQS